MTADEFRRLYGHSADACRGMTIGHPEEDLQRACVSWFRERYPELAPLLFHPNNEPFFGGSGKTDAQRRIAGARAKSIGVTPGVADLVLLYPAGDVHALCIEMKTRDGRQSEAQKAWQQCVTRQGYRYEVVRSLQAFQALIREHTGIEPLSDREVVMRNIERVRRMDCSGEKRE